MTSPVRVTPLAGRVERASAAFDPRISASAADGSGYFLYHSIGMFPGKEALIAEGLRKYAHLWSTPDDSQWPQALAIRQQFIECWRKLINAQPATVTTAETSCAAAVISAGSGRRLRENNFARRANDFRNICTPGGKRKA